jgi:hypothetical protein
MKDNNSLDKLVADTLAFTFFTFVYVAGFSLFVAVIGIIANLP